MSEGEKGGPERVVPVYCGRCARRIAAVPKVEGSIHIRTCQCGATLAYVVRGSIAIPTRRR